MENVSSELARLNEKARYCEIGYFFARDNEELSTLKAEFIREDENGAEYFDYLAYLVGFQSTHGQKRATYQWRKNDHLIKALRSHGLVPGAIMPRLYIDAEYWTQEAEEIFNEVESLGAMTENAQGLIDFGEYSDLESLYVTAGFGSGRDYWTNSFVPVIDTSI